MATGNVVALLGGLGNQLFQVAFGRGLEQQTGGETWYDISFRRDLAIESLCAGVPLIGADTLGFQWLHDVPHARLVPHDVKRWAAAIDAAANERVEVRADALAAARDRFQPKRAVDEYRAIYDLAINGRLIFRKATGRSSVH